MLWWYVSLKEMQVFMLRVLLKKCLKKYPLEILKVTSGLRCAGVSVRPQNHSLSVYTKFYSHLPSHR